jgi:hypothetical protein
VTNFGVFVRTIIAEVTLIFAEYRRLLRVSVRLIDAGDTAAR